MRRRTKAIMERALRNLSYSWRIHIVYRSLYSVRVRIYIYISVYVYICIRNKSRHTLAAYIFYYRRFRAGESFGKPRRNCRGRQEKKPASGDRETKTAAAAVSHIIKSYFTCNLYMPASVRPPIINYYNMRCRYWKITFRAIAYEYK